MSIKCANIDKLKTILNDVSDNTNNIGGDSKQIDYKINTQVVSIYEGTGSVVFRGKKSENCNIQDKIIKKIEAINELEQPLDC